MEMQRGSGGAAVAGILLQGHLAPRPPVFIMTAHCPPPLTLRGKTVLNFLRHVAVPTTTGLEFMEEFGRSLHTKAAELGINIHHLMLESDPKLRS